jgi:site-specific recombinase XerD
MKGTRPLDKTEIRKVQHAFDGEYEIRNRALFMIGISTGGRISELLSLTIGDVYQNDRPVTDLLFDKSIVKGKEHSRVVPVNADGQQAIATLMHWHSEKYKTRTQQRPLFPSRNKNGRKAIDRQTAHEALKAAFLAAGLNGKVASHSLRKTFAQRCYDQSGDIYLVQELLGHKNVSTTQKYIGVNYRTARETVDAIALDCEPDSSSLSSRSLQKNTDEALLLELALRGYDLTKIQHTKTETIQIETPADTQKSEASQKCA